MPDHHVFASMYRMYLYHYQHPAQYILIPCFFYGIIATAFSNVFYRQSTVKQIFTTLLIAVLTVIVSLPFGGMLWHLHDMQAGFFPTNWAEKMVRKGTEMGLSVGWWIVGRSFPYNLIGLVVCFFLTRKGSGLFWKE